MSNYSQINDYSAKDALATGNPEKLILGSDIDDELAAISVAVATKYDSADLASQAQAEAETVNTVLMTPLRVANWADYNAGIVGDLQALADPNADRIFGWDDSAGAAIGFAPDGTTITTSGTTLSTGSNVPLLNAENTFASNQVLALANPVLILRDTSGNATDMTAFVSLQDSGSVERGYVGFGAGTTVLNITNGIGAVSLVGTSVSINGVAATDFARLSQANAFTTNQTLNASAASSLYTTWSVAGTARFYIGDGASIGGTAGNLFVRSNNGLDMGGGGNVDFSISSAGNFDFKDGTVTTSNASASEVGKTGAPSRTISASTNTAASDQGGTVRMTGGSGQTFTLDSDVPADCFVLLDNASGNSWTIAASGTLTWAATGGTGSRTLANGGLAVALSLGSGNYKISGGGLS